MDSLDLFFKRYAYKFPKGYPNLNDEQDINLLADLLENLGVDLKEFNSDEIELNEEDETYDKVIKNVLKVDTIPQVKGNYALGKDTNIDGEDAKIFKLLYPVSPPKKGKEIDTAGSKGTGNGEISMYWLFAYQNGHTAKGTQGGGKPDLEIDGKGVEVKAYDSSRITLGRFGSDKSNIDLLNTLFGLDALVSTIEKTGDKDKKASSLNFAKSDIIRAFTTLQDFSTNKDLRDLSSKYPLIGNIYSKIDDLNNQLGLQQGAKVEDYAGTLVKRILLKKFSEKPGFGGYIVNITENGSLKFIQVTEEKIKNADNKNTLDNTFINQGSIIINPEGLLK
jgi:hypothetical protein